MRRFIPTLALLYACAPADEVPATDTDVPIDLSERLAEGEVRAGVLVDEAPLFAGVFAEGQVGDVMLKNSRVQLVIQGTRPGSYIVGRGGGVLDADIVRPEGQLGRDLVKDWVPNAGIARVVNPDVVEVINDGRNGEAAVVRVEGPESPITFIEGTLESPGFVADLGLRIEHTYTLEPDSWLVRVDTTMTATTGTANVPPGDLLMGAPEVAWDWVEGSGLDDGARGGPFRWTSYVGHHHDVAVAVLAADGGVLKAGALDLVSSAADLLVAFDDTVEVAPGAPVTFSRWYGVGPDLASLTDEVLARDGGPTDTLSGTVTAPDGPVAGAWVAVLVDDKPYTLAVTADDGSWSADVPAGSDATHLAIGRGNGRFLDLPEGATSYAPYAAPSVEAATRDGLAQGAVPVPMSEGRGVASAEAPDVLLEPGTLRVEVADGMPFMVRAAFTDAQPAVDPRLVPERPSGLGGAGWSTDGSIELALEPGTYNVLVQRGIRFEVHTETITVQAGQTATVQATLAQAYTTPGWLLADPHAHSASSADAEISMEDRVIVAAAHGLQLHFGTDHDRLADYRPLLPTLGLSPWLNSVVSNEFSLTLRGHFNIYPLTPDPSAPNLGAWSWWEDLRPTTDEMLEFLRERQPDPLIIQANHATDSGVASGAGWSVGRISNADRWTDELDTTEVINASDYESFFPFFLDLLNRGYVTTPVGVSDSHSHFAGSVGVSTTFIRLGIDAPSDYTDAGLVTAMQARATIASRGPYLDMSITPGSTIGAGQSLTVTAKCPSWCTVDRLVLLKDGAPVETVDDVTATFSLDADADASWIVVAEGDNPMQPVSGHTPWAMSSPILLDVDGDGWDPPLPPLIVR